MLTLSEWYIVIIQGFNEIAKFAVLHPVHSNLELELHVKHMDCLIYTSAII